MHKIAYSAALLVALTLGLVNAAKAEYTTECPYYVTGVAYNDVLNIRKWPSHRSRIVGVIPPKGHGVSLIRWKDNWGRIYYNGQYGWVNMRFLRADCH